MWLREKLQEKFEEFFSGEVEVGQESWHYRRYQYWRQHGHSKPAGYRENFCHYARVVLIWASLLWFFVVPVTRDQRSPFRWVRPWMLPAATATLASTALVVYKWPREVVIALVTLAVFCVVFLIIGSVMYLADEYPRQTRKVLLVVAAPVWAPLLGICLVLEQVYLRVIKPYGTPVLQWFIHHRYAKVIYPWMVAVVAAFAGICFVFGPQHVLLALLYLGLFLLVFVLLVAAVMGVYYLLSEEHGLGWGWIAFDWLSDRYDSLFRKSSKVDDETAKVQAKPTTSTLRLIVAFIVAKKRKICPYIILPEDQPAPVAEPAPGI